MEEADPEDPSDFTEGDLEGRRLRLRLEGEEGSAGALSCGSEKATGSSRSSRGGRKLRPGARVLPDRADTPMRRRVPAWGR